MASFDENLCICHINARSILAFNEDSGDSQFKMDEIRQILVNQMKYSLIAVLETWLTANTSIDDNDLKIDNFPFYRKDRPNGNRGGGVGIFISNDIYCLER